jgi:hypothetical protein
VKEGHLPERIRHAIDLWVENGTPPGHFVTACLENNLCEAFRRADNASMEALKDIVSYIYNEIPMDAWGSQEKMAAWSARFVEQKDA